MWIISVIMEPYFKFIKRSINDNGPYIDQLCDNFSLN